MKIIELRNVGKKYYQKSVFSSLSYVFRTDKIYLVVGANGSGKTTLIKGMLGLIRFSEGEIIAKPLKYAYLPEKIALPAAVTVYDFLKNIGAIKEVKHTEQKIIYLLRKWQLSGIKKIKELSKGMRQKVLIIQMLLSDADVYFLDEPLSGLDLTSRKNFLQLIEQLKQKGKTLIISSHYPNRFPYDKVLALVNGDMYEGFDKMPSSILD